MKRKAVWPSTTSGYWSHYDDRSVPEKPWGLEQSSHGESLFQARETLKKRSSAPTSERCLSSMTRNCYQGARSSYCGLPRTGNGVTGAINRLQLASNTVFSHKTDEVVQIWTRFVPRLGELSFAHCLNFT